MARQAGRGKAKRDVSVVGMVMQARRDLVSQGRIWQGPKRQGLAGKSGFGGIGQCGAG